MNSIIKNNYLVKLFSAKTAFLNDNIEKLKSIDNSLGPQGELFQKPGYSDTMVPNPVEISEFISEAINFLQNGAPQYYNKDGKVLERISYKKDYTVEDMHQFIDRWGDFSLRK